MKFKGAFVLLVVSGAMVFSPFGFADHESGEQLGTIRFAVSGKPAAQEHVVRGVKLVHHMMYPEADREFVAAMEADPSCALAYWGRAMSLVHPLWPDAPTEAERRLGAKQIQKGLNCPPATVRERAYLETLDRYFGSDASGDHVARLKALDEAWSALAEKYPDPPVAPRLGLRAIASRPGRTAGRFAARGGTTCRGAGRV